MAVQPRGDLTYEDYAAFPDDGNRYELFDGEMVVCPAPNVWHQRILGRLYELLAPFVRVNGLGEVFMAPCDVVLARKVVVQPDVFFVPTASAGIVTAPNIQGAPALVIEIVSDSRRDRVSKRRLYERYGILEYWIVDPDADRFEILRLQKGRYSKPEIVEPGETLTTPFLPGLRIDVGAILAR